MGPAAGIDIPMDDFHRSIFRVELNHTDAVIMYMYSNVSNVVQSSL